VTLPLSEFDRVLIVRLYPIVTMAGTATSSRRHFVARRKVGKPSFYTSLIKDV
jgi:hypothetical protein